MTDMGLLDEQRAQERQRRLAERGRFEPPFPDPPLLVCPYCGSEAGYHGDCRREAA